ncbi:lantibiotic dehydratase [Streptomyces sp. NPDC057148]|uniref:lantibiotic dehydratase n=1 Tax=unclassified Streptomyces TaxID=2593676 RepID=UPI003641F1A3
MLVRIASRPRGAALATVNAAELLPGRGNSSPIPFLGQAVRVTSGALARSLAGLTNGEGATALGRTRAPSAARPPTRYARRARAGPTPFGPFAGSAEPGWFGGPGGARRR